MKGIFDLNAVGGQSALFLDSASLAAFLGTGVGSGGLHLSGLRDFDPDKLFSCVGELWGDDMLLGSCTVLPSADAKTCFALTAAHVVRRKREKPYVRVSRVDRSGATPKPNWETRSVTQIHWQSGESSATSATTYPAGVERYRGEADRLVLLELESPFPPDSIKWFAFLPDGRHPFPGDVLVVAGWGEDAAGNHPNQPWAAITRCRLPVHSWRGVCSRDRGDFFNGMPRPGDSGGPVFMPSLSSPLPPRHLRLVGVHSGRVSPHGLPEEVAAYIPIDPLAEQWIRKTAGITESYPARTGYEEFLHRNRVACRRFPCDPKAILPFARKLRTKGADLLLKHGSRVDLREDNGTIVIKLQDPKTSQFQEYRLERETDVGAGGHWYTNARDPNAKATYYLFLKKESGSNGAWIHIEAFASGSTAIRPSASTVTLESTVLSTDADVGGGAGTAFVEDQDDEGNGHEDPP